MIFLILGFFISLSAGCGKGTGQPLKRYEIKGTIVAVDAAKSEVTIQHGPIQGYMDAMTMPFRVKDGRDVSLMESGDSITADLVVSPTTAWIENPIFSRSISDPAAPMTAHPDPSPGTRLPNFALTNQDGKKVSLGDYHGKAIALTFIYTRCPMPDYCILMNDNFSVVDKTLKQDAALYASTRLLTISFDPEHDTPSVLREFGLAHVDQNSSDPFRHWSFATGTPEQIKSLAEFFGLTYLSESGQIVHSLRTAIVAPDGTLFKLYDGNEWKPEDLINDLRTANGSTAK